MKSSSSRRDADDVDELELLSEHVVHVGCTPRNSESASCVGERQAT